MLLAKNFFEFYACVKKCHFGNFSIFQFCQNGTFEPLHEIQIVFWPKAFFWSTMRMAIRKNIHNLSQGWPNPGFMQEKVHKGDFLKKDSGELIFVLFCFRFLWSPRAWNARLGVGIFFWLSKNLYSQCA